METPAGVCEFPCARYLLPLQQTWHTWQILVALFLFICLPISGFPLCSLACLRVCSSSERRLMRVESTMEATLIYIWHRANTRKVLGRWMWSDGLCWLPHIQWLFIRMKAAFLCWVQAAIMGQSFLKSCELGQTHNQFKAPFVWLFLIHSIREENFSHEARRTRSVDICQFGHTGMWSSLYSSCPSSSKFGSASSESSCKVEGRTEKERSKLPSEHNVAQNNLCFAAEFQSTMKMEANIAGSGKMPKECLKPCYLLLLSSEETPHSSHSNILLRYDKKSHYNNANLIKSDAYKTSDFLGALSKKKIV